MSENDCSAVMREGSWKDLPDLVISQIFSNLTLKDRVSASAVCKNWSKGFASPSLWKCINIWLNGDPTKRSLKKGSTIRDYVSTTDDYLYSPYGGFEEDLEDHNQLTIDEDNIKELTYDETYNKDGNKSSSDSKSPSQLVRRSLTFKDEKALQFAERYGNCVKYLLLVCDPVTKNRSKSLATKLSQFLKSLMKNSCKIHGLIIYLSYNNDEWDETARNDLIKIFTEFFASQHELAILIFGNCLFDADIRILQAVAENSGSIIRILHCLYYGDKDSTQYQEIYCKTLSQFPNMKYISMSLPSLDNDTITILNNFKNLKTVYIYDLGNSIHMHWRPPKDRFVLNWKKPLQVHPRVQGHFGGEYWLRNADFPQFIPLKTEAYLNVQFRFRDNGEKMNEELKTIAKHHFKNLVSLTISNDEDHLENKPHDSVVRRIMTACTELQEFIIKANISINILAEIFKMQADNRIDLQSFWYRCVDCSKVEIQRLQGLLIEYEHVTSRCHWGGELGETYQLTEYGRPAILRSKKNKLCCIM